ncbi:MAG: DUF502 domain-containing protein [Bacteroidia bacterium]|jgi:uncharacterized membrane protein|nr:DUF502 domain-containing protein [Bacteroidia bacterium]
MKKLFSSHGFKNFIGHFVEGLLVIAPFAITVGVIFKIMGMLSSTLGFIPKIVNPLIDPLIIIAACIVIIYLTGRLSSSILFTPMYSRFEKDLEKVPLVRQLYSAVKDLLNAFMGSKRKFNRPVLVTLDKVNNIKQIGFITQEDLTDITADKDMIAVYLPFSYGFNGKLLIVPRESVSPIKASSAQMMKFVVSGGVTGLKEDGEPESKKTNTDEGKEI